MKNNRLGHCKFYSRKVTVICFSEEKKKVTEPQKENLAYIKKLFDNGNKQKYKVNKPSKSF